MQLVQAGDQVMVPGLQYLNKLGAESGQMILELIDQEVSLYVFGIGCLMHFDSGRLNRESIREIDLYYAIFKTYQIFLMSGSMKR